MNQEIRPYLEPEQHIARPVCAASEVMWLKFLYSLLKTPPHERKGLPVPTQYRIYDRTTKQIHENILGLHKRNVRDVLAGEKTILCLTGPLAGAICVSLAEKQNILEDWNINPDYIDADAVALRMIRNSFDLRPDEKYYFKEKFRVSIDDTQQNWFTQKLCELLTGLFWQYDNQQLRANAVSTTSSQHE